MTIIGSLANSSMNFNNKINNKINNINNNSINNNIIQESFYKINICTAVIPHNEIERKMPAWPIFKRMG